MARVLVAVMGPIFNLVSATGNARSKGWGSRIAWMNLDEGMAKAQAEKKPLMLVIHKKKCAACFYLRKTVSSSSEIQALSKSFVMVNLDWFETLREKQYQPDGEYLPRILFFGPDGQVMYDITNSPQGRHKYNYSKEGDIVKNMKKVYAIVTRENNS
ncbi:thioredoxin domain-containing protein 12 isoform X2 [Aplysia californica]|uniref:Thioredoxin domain-containing protein 12 isoform X2 n=1 Tax=Aplysia californica TaxID=6500 RepID=A0ABM0K447_APLCA|nr:thioredoxin domain-containing protein 12 isoform X2 [Aplysia californica]